MVQLTREQRNFVAILSFVILFVSSFLIGFSYDIVRPWEVALRLNRNTVRLGEDPPRVYGDVPDNSGRFFTGLGQKFLTFPRTHVIIRFRGASQLQARTKEGLQVSLDLSLQYSLKRDPQELQRLYERFGENYDAFFRKYVRAVVRDVLSDFNVRELWEQRPLIASRAQTALESVFDSLHAQLHGFQVLNLEIPVPVQNAIQGTAIEFQRIELAQNEKDVQTVLANTLRLEAQQHTLQLLVDAEGTAETVQLEAGANATAFSRQLTAESIAYSALKAELGFSTQELLAFVWLKFLQETSATSVLLHVPSPVHVGVPQAE